MATDWKTAYAEMHAKSEAMFPPAALHYVVELCRQASQRREGRVVTPEELTEDFRKQFRRDFGSMGNEVRNDWGIHSSADLGKAVILLGKYGCLTLEPTDTEDAFTSLGTTL